MKQHLLDRAQSVTVIGIPDGVDEVKALVVHARDKRVDVEALMQMPLSPKADMGLDGVEGRSGGPIVLVDADVPKELVAGPSGHH